MRRLALALLASSLVACSGATDDVLTAWDDAALCGDGAVVTTGAPILWPAPHVVAHLGARAPLASATIFVDARGFELPALDRVAEDAELARVDSASGAAGGLVVHVLGADALAVIAERCHREVPEGDEAHVLAVRARAGGAEVIIAARTRRGASRAAALLAQTLDPTDHTFATASVFDGPETRIRGVLEGFYGPAWREEERIAMLRWTFRARMNVLVWAPKSEAGSRIFWRGDYPPETIAHLRALFAEAHDLDVDLCAEVSPGNGILYSDPAERALLEKKLDGLVTLGATCLVVAFDDIARDLRDEDAARYPGGLGEAQADLVAELFPKLAAKHPGVRLGFTPTDYATRDMDAHPDYTAAVAAKLPKDVLLGWTGEEIVSPTVTAADVDRVTALWGRAPLMGDNYPVSDSDRGSGRVQLGPVVGREAEAIRKTSGWVANTLCLPFASTIALETMNEQLWRPDAYTPEDAWARAIAIAAGDHAEALTFFASHARSSALDPTDAAELGARGDAFLASFPAPSAALEAHFARMANVEAELRPIGALADELAPWTAQLAAYGRAGTVALELTKAKASGAGVTADDLDLLAAEVARLADTPVKLGGGVPDRLLAAIVERLRP